MLILKCKRLVLLSLFSFKVLCTLDLSSKISRFESDFGIKQLKILRILDYPFPTLVCTFAKRKIVVLSLEMILLSELIVSFHFASVHRKSNFSYILVILDFF